MSATDELARLRRHIAATLGRPTFDANLEQALSFMRIWISEDAHLGESAISYELEKAEGLRKLDAIESAIAATLGGGKLTAEQVRKTVEKHWYDLPAEYDMPEATALPEYSYDWQAIADELNAHAERTCKLTLDGTDGNFGCSECLENIPPLSNFCPNCGARVIGGNE